MIGSKVKEVFAEFQTDLPVRKIQQAEEVQDIEVDTEDTSYIMLRFENGAVGNAVFSQVYQGKKNQTTYPALKALLLGTVKILAICSLVIAMSRIAYGPKTRRLHIQILCQ